MDSAPHSQGSTNSRHSQQSYHSYHSQQSQNSHNSQQQQIQQTQTHTSAQPQAQAQTQALAQAQAQQQGSMIRDGSIVQMPYGAGLVTHVQGRLAIIPVVLQTDAENNVVVFTRNDVPTQFLPMNPLQLNSLTLLGVANVSVVGTGASSPNTNGHGHASMNSSYSGSAIGSGSSASSMPSVSINGTGHGMSFGINDGRHDGGNVGDTVPSLVGQFSMDTIDDVDGAGHVNTSSLKDSMNEPLLGHLEENSSSQVSRHDSQHVDDSDSEEDDSDNGSDSDDDDEYLSKRSNFATRLVVLVLFALVVLITALWLGTRDSYEEITPVYLMFNGVVHAAGPNWASRRQAQAQGLPFDPTEPTAFVVGSNGRFLKVGGDEELIQNPDYSKIPHVDLQKKVVIPGIGDAHGHVTFHGFGLVGPQIRGATSPQQIVDILLQFCKEHDIDPAVDNGVFLTAWGWDHELFTADSMTYKTSTSLNDIDEHLEKEQYHAHVHSELSFTHENGSDHGHELGGGTATKNAARTRPFPRALDLDTAFPGLPVVLDRVDGHAVWANSAAMQVVGPIPTKDPDNGRIDRDDDGKPLGCFFDEAIMIFKNHRYNTIPKGLRSAAVFSALKDLSSYGITTVHHHAMLSADYEVMQPLAESLRSFAYKSKTYGPDLISSSIKKDIRTTSLIKTTSGHGLPLTSDPFPVRIHGYIDADRVCIAAMEYNCPPPFPAVKPLDNKTYLNNPSISPSGFPVMRSSLNGRLQAAGAKIFLDGSLGSYGAALKEPYYDKQDSKGTLYYPEALASYILLRLFKQGFQLAVHAVGDKAVEVALNGFAAIADDEGTPFSDPRHRLEHAQVIDVQNDLPSMIRYGVIPSLQPIHATSDMSFAKSRLGEERLETQGYLTESLRSTVSRHLPFGTDFPIESPNPWATFHAAVTRQDKNGQPVDGFLPKEKVSRHFALKSMTYDVAFASKSDQDAGSIIDGKIADFVILDKDQDLMTIPENELLNIKPLATFVDGNLVYAQDTGSA